MKRVLSVILVLAMLLAAAQAVFAEESDPVKGIFGALTAESSDYSKTKAMMKEYYPDIQYEETLEGDRFTITVTGGGQDGSWTFAKEGDYLAMTAKEEDYNAYSAAVAVLRAAADYYGMDPVLVNAYIAGLEALGMENPYFKAEKDDAAGTLTYSVNIAGAYDMKELDRMVLTEDVLNLYDFTALTEDYTSHAANLGKVSMVCNGNKDGLVILLMEYGGLDDLAYTDLVNLVKALQPAGWEAFAAEYTKLKDAEGSEYKATLNVDKAAAQEIIDDPPESYSYAIVRFGTEVHGGESADATAGETAGETAEESEWASDTQYVLFLGTNDKDTNKPVFNQAEAMEKAKDILIRHFGGYTIQEASGGWIDGDKVYQEYTLVIYLSDTTLDKVHEAADEMVDVFRQSSVLIEAYPTKTEFYSGK